MQINRRNAVVKSSLAYLLHKIFHRKWYAGKEERDWEARAREREREETEARLKSNKFPIKQAVILKRCDVWNRDRLLHVSNEIWTTNLRSGFNDDDDDEEKNYSFCSTLQTQTHIISMSYFHCNFSNACVRMSVRPCQANTFSFFYFFLLHLCGCLVVNDYIFSLHNDKSPQKSYDQNIGHVINTPCLDKNKKKQKKNKTQVKLNCTSTYCRERPKRRKSKRSYSTWGWFSYINIYIRQTS